MNPQLYIRIAQLNDQLGKGVSDVVPSGGTSARIATVAILVAAQLRSVAVATIGGTAVTFWPNTSI